MNPAVLFGVLLITALHAFDELVLVIALPAIAGELAAADWYGLIIASYVLASIIGMAWAGKRIDVAGPRQVLQAGAGFFCCGLLLAVVSQNTTVFLIARILQGVGGGIGWTLAFGLISLLSPPAQKPRAVAAMDVAWIIPSLLAPLIGGVLVDYLSWRWIFVFQLLPVVIAFLLITPRIRHLDKPASVAAQHRKQQLVIMIDAIAIALGTGLMLYAFGRPVGAVWLLIPLALFLVRAPLARCMPAGWLRLQSPLSASLFIAMMGFMVFYGLEAWQPLYLIELRGFTTLSAGLALTSASISWMVTSQLSAHNRLPSWLQVYSARFLAGLGLLLLSLLLFGLLLEQWLPALSIFAVMACAGFGMGLCFSTARATAMAYTTPGQEGFVAGAISLSVSLGLSLATGIGGALRNQVAAKGGDLNEAMAWIWLFSLLMALLTTALLWRHHRLINPASVQANPVP
ncbi:MAG: MFS transporter [Pseudomonadota bacterium]